MAYTLPRKPCSQELIRLDMKEELCHLRLRDERQRQHAGVVGDEDGVHVGVGEHPRLRGQHLGLAVHQRGAGPGTRAHLAL